MNEGPFEMLEGLVVDLMRQFKITGMSIGVVMDGEHIYARGFGARNLEKNLPMTPDTLWGIASISKSFCALAIMQLVEKGKIDLETPANKYINFKLGTKDNPITIHHLLSHSSGLPELDATTSATNKDTFIPMSSEKDFMTFINKADQEIFDKPGNIFLYNNDMYTCLGLIIEKVTNVKYAEYVRENILAPLQMKRSNFTKEGLEKDNDVITGYVPSKDGKSLELEEIKIDELTYACGGLYSSVRELQNYVIALVNDGVFSDNQLIQKSSLEKMWTPYIVPPKRYLQGVGGYGYGWGIERDFFGHTLVQHGGNIATSGGFLAMIPEKKLGVVVGQIPNPATARAAPEAIVRGVLAVLMGEDMNKAVPIIGIQEKLDQLLGKYKTYGAVQGEVSMQDGILYAKITFSGQTEPLIFPLSVENLEELKFSVPIAFPNQTIEVQFIVDEETGKVHLQADRYYFHKI